MNFLDCKKIKNNKDIFKDDFKKYLIKNFEKKYQNKYNILIIRINPKNMQKLKYSLEDKITRTFFYNFFNINILYLPEIFFNFEEFYRVDCRWEKLLTLFFYLDILNEIKDKYKVKIIYTDHDVFFDIKKIKFHYSYGAFGPYNSQQRMIASFIDIDTLNQYYQYFKQHKFILKDIWWEEELLYQMFFSLKSKKIIIDLSMNSFSSLNTQMHFNADYLIKFIFKNKHKFNQNTIKNLSKNIKILNKYYKQLKKYIKEFKIRYVNEKR